MAVKDLINGISGVIPKEIISAANELPYRNFVTVGLLINKLNVWNRTRIKTINDIIPELWIYVQEKKVRMGRIQVFNNWSPYLITDPDKVWLGLEYFMNDEEELWTMSDNDFASFAISELERISFADKKQVLDFRVIRIPKAYPGYFGSFGDFDVIRNYTDTIENLFLIGRNGMHRYNNMDHSMLSAMTAVNDLIRGITTKENIWKVNIESNYYEEK
jgi:protoporphyrinogen oxidase